MSNNNENLKRLPPLLLAAENGDLKRITELIDLGESVTQTLDNGATALHFASRSGNLKIINLLVEKDESLLHLTHEDGSTALHWAARVGRLEVVKLLIELGSDIYKSGTCYPFFTPLQEAKKNNHTEVVNAIENILNQRKNWI